LCEATGGGAPDSGTTDSVCGSPDPVAVSTSGDKSSSCSPALGSGEAAVVEEDVGAVGVEGTTPSDRGDPDGDPKPVLLVSTGGSPLACVCPDGRGHMRYGRSAPPCSLMQALFGVEVFFSVD